MEKDKLIIKGYKRQSLEAWVDEINGVTFDFTYMILIQISRAVNDLYRAVD